MAYTRTIFGYPWSLPEFRTEFSDDFHDVYALTSNLTVDASSPWIGTALNTGTMLQTTADPGSSVILSGAATTDNSGVQIQTGTSGISLPTTAGQEAGFICRAKLSEATDSEFFCGLAVADTTLLDGTGTLAAGLTHSDSFCFYKPDNQTHIFLCMWTGTAMSASIDLGAPPNATGYNIYAARYVAQSATGGQMIAYINGAMVSSATVANATVQTTRDLRPSIAMLSGTASGTITATVDYGHWYASRVNTG